MAAHQLSSDHFVVNWLQAQMHLCIAMQAEASARHRADFVFYWAAACEMLEKLRNAVNEHGATPQSVLHWLNKMNRAVISYQGQPREGVMRNYGTSATIHEAIQFFGALAEEGKAE